MSEIKEQDPNRPKAIVSAVRKKVWSVQVLLCLHCFPENRQLTGNSAHARDKKLGWNLCLNAEKCFFGLSVNNAGRPAFHLDQKNCTLCPFLEANEKVEGNS
jgi:hypothetical protein